MNHNICVIPALKEHESIIAQLYELYTYEMTDLADFDIGDNGFYGYEELPLYWTDPNRYPYLIFVNEKLAGFVLVQQGSPLEKELEVFDIAEFFVMRKFRKQGIGKMVAHKIFQELRGKWQVRVWDNNPVAMKFWQSAIKSFMQESIAPKIIQHENQHRLFIYQFDSREKP